MTHTDHCPSSCCTYFAPWQVFHRPFVRDLAFAIASPNVLKYWQMHPSLQQPNPPIQVHDAHFWQQHFQAYLPRLRQLDSTPEYQSLTRFLLARPSPYRLGFHFEGLLLFWLTDGYRLAKHPFELLAHNIVLYRDKQTAGELDFIIHNHAEDVIEHWELSIKFYLGYPPYEPENWVGLNSSDNLQRKIQHMQCKPFRTLWVDTDMYHHLRIQRRYAVIKGRFFVPMVTDMSLMYEWLQRLDTSHWTQFVRPDWLCDGLPLHPYLTQQQLGTLLAKDNADVAIRWADYIEWFTQRRHLNRSHNYRRLSVDTDGASVNDLRTNDLRTGLYFLTKSHRSTNHCDWQQAQQRCVIVNGQHNQHS